QPPSPPVERGNVNGRPTCLRSVSSCAPTCPTRFVRGKSLGATGRVLPRRPGVRGGPTMIANTALLAGLKVFLLAAWLASELSFLAPYKAALFRLHGRSSRDGAPRLSEPLRAYYLLARWFFMGETGRKVTHMDRDLIASEGVHEDRPPELWSTRG